MRRKVINVRISSPNDYWSYITSSNKTDNSVDINSDIVFDLKKLNASNDNANENVDADNLNVQIEHSDNNEISVEEIIKNV